MSVAAPGQVITYNGDVFPESVGWERVGTFDADRSLVDGQLVIDVDLGVWDPLPGGEQDFYKRSIAEFAGEPFFLEWRCVTNAPNTEIGGVGGSAINAWGTGVANHFTITGDRVRLIRDNFLPIVFVDIDPAVSHTYRLEYYRDESYFWYIDGEIVDSGVPEGDFPNPNSRIIWGSSMWQTPSTNQWDYIRYGVIPEPGTLLLLIPGAAFLVWRGRQAPG